MVLSRRSLIFSCLRCLARSILWSS
ncbi:hypothetical protein NC652_011561 [Populus alba x Populus x berolinensis]|nr:hypothetical protein NC652_011561 [Populus alba x Populus x berolinensis]